MQKGGSAVQSKPVPQYYTIQEAIVILGLSDRTIRNYIRDGKIKARQYGAGGRILIPKSEVDPDAYTA